MELMVRVHEGEHPYEGFEDYAGWRARILSEAEKRLVLACTAYTYLQPRIRAYLGDSKGKLPVYEMKRVVTGLGPVAYYSVARGPVYIARGLPPGEAYTLFRLSRCLSNFRAPLSVFLRVEDWRAAAANLTVRYAGGLIGVYEAILAAGRGELPARMWLRLRRRLAERAVREARDPLQAALSACTRRMEADSGRSPLARDLLRYASGEARTMVYADGEEVPAMLHEYGAGCPLVSLTMVSLEHGYVAHSLDSA